MLSIIGLKRYLVYQSPNDYQPIEVSMETVSVSPKYQIVIPKQVRDRLSITPGQQLQVMLYEDRMELIPVRTPRSMRGYLRGIDTTVERDEDRV